MYAILEVGILVCFVVLCVSFGYVVVCLFGGTGSFQEESPDVGVLYTLNSNTHCVPFKGNEHLLGIEKGHYSSELPMCFMLLLQVWPGTFIHSKNMDHASDK